MVANGERPLRVDSIPNCYWNLITRCWNTDPDERPTFQQIVNELKSRKFIESLKINESKFNTYLDYIEGKNVDLSKTFQKVAISDINPPKIEDFSIMSALNENEFFKVLPNEIQEIFDDILAIQNKKSANITFSPDQTMTLYNNNIFSSDSFIDVIQIFNSLKFEVDYSSNCLEQILLEILKLNEYRATSIVIIVSDTYEIVNFPKIVDIPFSCKIKDSVKKIGKNAFNE